MAIIARPEELEALMGKPVAVTRAVAILEAASTLVRNRTGRAWVDAAGDPLDDVDAVEFATVKTVVLQVAQRVYLNPQGITQQSTGPFSRSVSAWAALGLSLTEAESEMLPVSSTARPMLWTQSTTRTDGNDVPDIYLDVVDGDPIVHVPVGQINW